MSSIRHCIDLIEAINRPRVFYRGVNPGETKRIRTGNDFWDDHLFVSSDRSGALVYGKHIMTFEAAPEARILYEGTREFRSVAKGLSSGRRGYINISLARYAEIV